MAWVTKSSTEEYNQTPEPPKQYTRREKAGNWWHYNRIVVIIVVVVLAILAGILYDMFGRPEPDYTIGWVGDIDLPEDTAQALTDQLTAICDDRNGDGRVLVELAQFPYNFRGESTADASYQMAVITRLEGDLGTDDGCYIFLLQDPEGFENHTQVLQYLDGTLPAEDAEDWQNMVYRWSDCPVLAGLDLGDYTGVTTMDDVSGSSQDYLANVYIARRANRQDGANDYYNACDVLWQTLTEGAVPLSADETDG